MEMNNRDLLFEKEMIKLQATKMHNLIRVHSDLIFKNKKGKKFKEDLLHCLSLITDMNGRSPTDFYKIDKTYRAVENLVNCEIENLKDDDLIAFYRINRNFDKEPITEEAKAIEKRQKETL